MSRLWRTLVPLLLTVAWMVSTPAVARADGEDWEITRYDVAARFDAAGTAQVSITFDFDFGNDPGHGPFVTFPERQAVGGDPDVWRMVDIDLGAVSSPSGAPADVETTREDGSLVVRIGDPDIEVRGVQTYTVAYTARGLIAPRQDTSGLDEVNWNAIGTGWQVPLRNVSATVEGPVAVERAACFTGAGFDRPCEATVAGAVVTYEQVDLEPGQGLQLVAGFPAGTFTDAEPRFEKRFHAGNLFPLTPLSGGLTAALTVLGLGAVLLRTRRASRDEVYVGLTPGVRPAAGSEASVGRATGGAPVAVAFTPPKGARPGELGVLMDAVADNVDVTATIIDLAVRGHIQITETGRDSWRFTHRTSPDNVTGPERHVLDTLFSEGSEVTTADLRDKEYHDLLPGTRSRLYDRVTGGLHWFTAKPSAVRVVAVLAGIGLVLLGLVLGLGLAFAFGLGLVGLAFVVTGLAVIALSSKFGRRTAEGSAVLAETKGFELYLRTAEADQIRFEEGVDVFSRYLPYAIVFGVADRWAKVFSELAAQGRYQPGDWYVGPTGYFYGAHFGHAMDSLAGNLSSSMQASVMAQTQATAGTSGGSGFSGGGGFGGGGGGGW